MTLHPVDLEEAERSKSLGNAHMPKKEYELAAHAYQGLAIVAQRSQFPRLLFQSGGGALEHEKV